MSLMLLKKISLLFLLIAAAFLSTSFAGRRTKFVSKLAVDEVEEAAIDEEMSGELSSTDDHEMVIHERLLRANAKDYGQYDPAPALVRPPFKLIPN